jgi:MPBQ/MSBQ methyltransferase
MSAVSVISARESVDLVASSKVSPSGPLVEYYTEAGPDFAAWSPSFNMHFGFWRRGLRPWRLEGMLDQMNAEVLARLGVAGAPRLLDLGCGLGATARSLARRLPRASVTGVTLVPWQVEHGRHLTRSAGLSERVHVVQADYRALPWADRSFDGAYAIESACHAAGPAKSDFLREAARVLRPGSRLVVTDAFRKHARPFNPLLRRCYDAVCRFWCVDTFAEIEAFRREAARLGFEDVRVEEVSWRIVPSVLFVPLVTARFLWRELVVRRARLTPRRWGNALAPTLGMALGAARSAFGYYIVTATKPSS